MCFCPSWCDLLCLQGCVCVFLPCLRELHRAGEAVLSQLLKLCFTACPRTYTNDPATNRSRDQGLAALKGAGARPYSLPWAWSCGGWCGMNSDPNLGTVFLLALKKKPLKPRPTLYFPGSPCAYCPHVIHLQVNAWCSWFRDKCSIYWAVAVKLAQSWRCSSSLVSLTQNCCSCWCRFVGRVRQCSLAIRTCRITWGGNFPLLGAGKGLCYKEVGIMTVPWHCTIDPSGVNGAGVESARGWARGKKPLHVFGMECWP